MPATTIGPLGFPLTDRQAIALDTILKKQPKSEEFAYRKTVFAKAPTELNPGERSDVSWISTEAVDRYGHVVFGKGMDDSQFALNPIVTLNHCYDMPPIGRSLWRKYVKDGPTHGIKAKTVYPTKPDSWGDEPWPPDKVFTLIQAGLLNGKSIGWLPIKSHWADSKETVKHQWPDGTLVIEEWLLIEYAVGTIPVNPETVVDIVAKAAPLPSELCKALGWEESAFQPPPKPDPPYRFTPLSQIEQALKRLTADFDINKILADTIDRQLGRV